MDVETQNKIDRQFEKLMEDHTCVQLQSMHEETFGVVSKARDKARLAAKIANYLVTGEKGSNGQSDLPMVEKPKGNAGPSSSEDERTAAAALHRAKGAWDEVERLTDEKKSKVSELNQTIAKTRSKIAEVLNDDKTNPDKKVGLVEAHWRTLTRTEEKKSAISKEYNNRIKDAKQQVKTEFENVRQIPLPL